MTTGTADRWLSLALPGPGQPLQQVWRQGLPVPGAGEVRIQVATCGVCRTDLHIVDGELPFPGHSDAYDDLHAAPLLCAGLIGWRAYRMAGDGLRSIGLYGFGAAAHLVAQVARHQGCAVHAFTRPGDHAAQALALQLGACWAGGSDMAPPQPLDAALLFAPVGALVPKALQDVRAGGTVVCAGIHMSDIPAFPYRWLWGERRIVSVANLTRAEGLTFMQVAAGLALQVHTVAYPLQEADRALDDLRAGRVAGAAVLQC